MNQLKCLICKKEIRKGEKTYKTLRGKIVCRSCYQKTRKHPSVVVRFSPDGKNETISFNNEFGSFNGKMPEPIKSEKWVKINIWEGFPDWKMTREYKKIADGWITGFPDNTVQRKIDLHELFSDLQNWKIVPPCNMFWIIGQSSNIFSNACVVVVRKKDVRKMKKWLLGKMQEGIKGLETMLS